MQYLEQILDSAAPLSPGLALVVQISMCAQNYRAELLPHSTLFFPVLFPFLCGESNISDQLALFQHKVSTENKNGEKLTRVYNLHLEYI